jgi:hypothetical protein
LVIINISTNENYFDHALQIKDYYRNDFLERISLKDDLIYHCTSPEGLKSIIQNKSIRFSTYYCLNDKNELQYFVNILLELLESEKGKYNNNYFYDIVQKTYNKNNFFDNLIGLYFYD